MWECRYEELRNRRMNLKHNPICQVALKPRGVVMHIAGSFWLIFTRDESNVKSLLDAENKEIGKGLVGVISQHWCVSYLRLMGW